jgi:hypothetical protein
VSTIEQDSISSVNDNAIKMNNSVFGRALSLGSYSTARIGFRGQFINVSGAIVGARFAFGLCHGTTNMIGDATCDHFCGAYLNGAQWSWNGPGAGSVVFSDSLVPATKVNTTLTTGTQFTGDWRVGGNAVVGAYRMGYYLDFIKGSPNFTLKLQSGITVPGTATDLSTTNFLNSMVQTVDANTLMTNVSNGGTSSQTIAVNEGANGTLDTLTFWWNQSTTFALISDIAVAVLA